MSNIVTPIVSSQTEEKKIEVINDNFNILNDNITSQITKIDYLDIVKLVTTCYINFTAADTDATANNTAAAETVKEFFNNLNLYEAFVFEPTFTDANGDASPNYNIKPTFLNWTLKYGDIISKGDEEVAQLIPSADILVALPKHLSDDTTSADYNILTWELVTRDVAVSRTLPTFNTKGELGTAIYNEKLIRVDSAFANITGLTIYPVLHFYTTDNIEIEADSNWYTIAITDGVISITFDNTVIPSLIEYILVR